MKLRFFAALLLTVTAAVHAAPPDDVWMSVLLDGRKIGAMHSVRHADGARVTTAQTLDLELERDGQRIALSTSQTDIETPQGQPLGFTSRSLVSNIETVRRGERMANGEFRVTGSVGGAQSTRTLVWPQGALLSEGARLDALRHGLAPGTRYTTRLFQPDSLDAENVESRIGARESVDLPEGARTLTRIDQTENLDGAPMRSVAWVDANLTLRKLRMPLLGYELTLLECSQACASAPNQSADILAHALLAAPRALTAQERHDGLRLKLRAGDAGSGAPQFADTDEQQVVREGATIELRIRPLHGGDAPAREAPPEPADSRPNDWLQSRDPLIVKLAQQGAGEAASPAARMQNLEDFVRAYIRNKDMNVGYASALEVAKNPEGDCTEHAVLLAALGRALGIPTRVVDGLVYVDAYAGSQRVFVPHAWTQAYIDGRWRSFDAALHGFDAGHVALTVGDGDPSRYYAGIGMLGRMRIESVAPPRLEEKISN